MGRGRPSLHPNLLRIALALAIAGVVPADARASTRWTVEVAGHDATAAAAVRQAGDVLLVDLNGLAAPLRLTVETDGDQVRIVDARGREWRGRSGQDTLESEHAFLRLTRPVLLERKAVWMAINDAAGLASLEVYTDARARRATMAPPRPRLLDAPAGGWQSFTLAKPASERTEEYDELARRAALPPILPPSHDLLRVAFGAGHVAGGDGALDVVASGNIAGLSTDATAFITVGARGARWHSGRASLVDAARRWRADAGDLSSEIDGVRRGGRVSLDWAGGHRSSVSLYLPQRLTLLPQRNVAAAFGQSLSFGRKFGIVSEVSTARTLITSARFVSERVALGSHYRVADGRAGWGSSGSLHIWRQLAVTGTYDSVTPEVFVDPRVTRGIFEQRGERSAAYGIRVPFIGKSTLSLDRRSMTFQSTQASANAATLEVPGNRLRLFARVQHGETLRFASGIREPRTEVTGLLAYAPAEWLSLNVSAARYFQRNGVTARNEVFANLRLSAATNLQVTTWADRAETGVPLRLRFSQELGDRYGVVAEYGVFGHYQQARSFDDPGLSRFRVVVRRRFDVPTPAAGGRVEGLVLDQLLRPLAGVVVRLGEYRTSTQENGRFVFDKVPAGTFELYLDDAHLPAGYAARGARTTVRVTRGTRLAAPFVLAPLNVIPGRVFIDRNANATFDAGEGVGGVLVFAANRPMLTDADGGFMFHNVAPGTYRVSIDATKLPQGTAASDVMAADVVVRPGRPVDEVDLRLVTHDKSIVFQELQ